MMYFCDVMRGPAGCSWRKSRHTIGENYTIQSTTQSHNSLDKHYFREVSYRLGIKVVDVALTTLPDFSSSDKAGLDDAMDRYQPDVKDQLWHRGSLGIGWPPAKQVHYWDLEA